MINKQTLNIRQMQAYAGVCLWRFCNDVGIKHIAVDQLISHLIGILIAEDLSEWEVSGTRLDITGRGDPVPTSVLDEIDDKYLDNFHILVEHSVEGGIVDMYGAQTDRPYKFLQIRIKLVQQLGISILPPRYLNKHTDNDAWGKVISAEEYSDFIEYFNINL